jgi:N-acetylmuramoyl-L-alanine amidase
MEQSVTSHSPLTGDYFMLKCTANPSVIVECGFLSNAEDEKLLSDTVYQKAVAYAIFKGAVAFYG